MGGSFEETGVIICEGDDVINDLNAIFGNPHSDAYKRAQKNNTFGGIPNAQNNWQALVAAYQTAGLNVSTGWQAYLQRLGTVNVEGPAQGPTNIYKIAQMRYHGLLRGKKMKTSVHVPQHGGHVDTGSGPSEDTISSPCPLPPN